MTSAPNTLRPSSASSTAAPGLATITTTSATTATTSRSGLSKSVCVIQQHEPHENGLHCARTHTTQQHTEGFGPDVGGLVQARCIVVQGRRRPFGPKEANAIGLVPFG